MYLCKKIHYMKIEITGRKTIGQIQDEFHAAYPFLKIAFFSQPHRAHEGTPAASQITDRELSVGHLREIDHDGSVYIDPDMIVWHVERLFETEFGLHVQVLRKSGSVWLETSMTDDLTLEDQNARGHAYGMSHTESEEPIDYREQD